MIKKGMRFISDRGSIIVIKSYVKGFSLKYQHEDTKREYTIALEGTDERFLNVFKPLEGK